MLTERAWAHQMLQQLEAEVLHLQGPAISHQGPRNRHHCMRLAGLQLQVLHTILRQPLSLQTRKCMNYKAKRKSG